jgi:hypothetical protein
LVGLSVRPLMRMLALRDGRGRQAVRTSRNQQVVPVF